MAESGDRVRFDHIPADAHRLAIPGGARAAGEAREFAGKLLSEWALDADAAYDVLLIVSELVTNAVVYGVAPVCLWLWLADGCVRGAVDDRGDGVPRFADLGDLCDDMSEHGRGLALVAAVAAAVGWLRLPGGGLRVWFTYAVGGRT